MVTRTRRTITAAAPAFAAALVLACAGRLDGVVRSQAAQDLGCPEAQIQVSDLGSGGSLRDYSVTGCGRQEHYQAGCGMAGGGCVAYRPGDAARYPDPASDGWTAGEQEAKPAEPPADVGTTTEVGDAATPEEAGARALGRALQAEAGAGAPEAEVGAPGAEVGAPGDGAGAPGDGPAEGATLEPAAGQTVVPATPRAGGPGKVAAPLGEERTVILRNACVRRVVFYIGRTPGEAGGRYMTLGSTNMISPRLRVGEQVWLLDEQQAGLTSVTVAARTEEIEVADSCVALKLR